MYAFSAYSFFAKQQVYAFSTYSFSAKQQVYTFSITGVLIFYKTVSAYIFCNWCMHSNHNLHLYLEQKLYSFHREVGYIANNWHEYKITMMEYMAKTASPT